MNIDQTSNAHTAESMSLRKPLQQSLSGTLVREGLFILRGFHFDNRLREEVIGRSAINANP